MVRQSTFQSDRELSALLVHEYYNPGQYLQGWLASQS